jgi:asparagine synthase (glutamine-hydrolysing)
VAQGGIEPHYLVGDRLHPWEEIDTVLWQQDGPFESPFLFMRRALCALAHEAGVRILLDGFMGDVVVSHGMAYLTELLRQWRWWAFVTQIVVLKRTLYRHYPVSMRSLLWDRGIRPLAPASVVRLRRWWRRQCAGERDVVWAPILQPSFARRLNLTERIMASRGYVVAPAQTAREEHQRFLSSGLYYGFEVSDKAAAAHLSASHPFANARLVEFCLALPSEQKLNQGWTRLVFRRAMAHILPEDVQWRRDKSNHHPFLLWALFGASNREFIQETLRRDAARLGDYVDLVALRAAYERNASRDNHRSAESARTTQDALRVWRVVLLARWLGQEGLPS